MKSLRRILCACTSAALLLGTLPFLEGTEHTVSAADSAYPVQEFRIAIGDTDANVSGSGASLVPSALTGDTAEKWSLNYVSSGVYEIVNSDSGSILTASGSGVSLAADVDGANQRWNIEGVQKDSEGYYLYYKITSNADKSKALTFTESNGFSVSSYSGAEYQKFKLNLDGLQGYAANCVVDGKEKAGTIGGLLGETVFVSSTEEMKKAMERTDPLTIVMTKTLDFHPYGQVVIKSNKTLTGYYGVTLKDCQLRTAPTDTSSSEGPYDNLVFRNLNFLAHESTNCMLFNIYSSRQIWIDHCTFESKLNRTVDEVGKFIWCNSPFDGTFKSRATDFITISYCKFYNRYWTTLFASVSYEVPSNEKIRCRISLLYCFYDQCVRRCPQLGSAYGHIVSGFWRGMGTNVTDGIDQIIGGGQTDVVSQNCRFEAIASGHEICAGGGDEPYRDDNSTPTALNFKGKVTSTRHPETENYGYSLIAPTGNKNTKDFCLTYSGSAGSKGALKYITDSDMADWVAACYPDPFLRHVDFAANTGAVFDTAYLYTFQNVGSGLYLEAADANNGANVQQGKSSDKAAYTWKLEDAENGYYYIYSTLGDGSYCIDLPYGNTDNGTSIGLWTNDQSDARKFKFINNGDGTYAIATKCTNGQSVFGVNGGSSESGADVIQWVPDGSDSQKWYVQMKLPALVGEYMEIDRFDLEHADSYAIGSDLQIGSKLFGDRDAAYSEIPDELLGTEYLMTACDAKGLTTDAAEITVLKECTLYVALDSRMETVPAFLGDWMKTDLTVKNNMDVTFVLYAKECAVGETVMFGGNGQSYNVVNYTVIAVQANKNAIKGDVNSDGSFGIADVVLLQKWLLAVPDTHLVNWKAADLCEDDKLDVFDLCLMKRELLK